MTRRWPDTKLPQPEARPPRRWHAPALDRDERIGGRVGQRAGEHIDERGKGTSARWLKPSTFPPTFRPPLRACVAHPRGGVEYSASSAARPSTTIMTPRCYVWMPLLCWTVGLRTQVRMGRKTSPGLASAVRLFLDRLASTSPCRICQISVTRLSKQSGSSGCSLSFGVSFVTKVTRHLVHHLLCFLQALSSSLYTSLPYVHVSTEL